MTGTTAPAALAVTVSELVAALRAQQRGGAAFDELGVPAITEGPGGAQRKTILVVAAHAGAGATAVSVALADALADVLGASGSRVQLIDAAPDECSGMLGATEREMASATSSWRTGRRGTITVLRPVHTTASADLRDLPPLPTPARTEPDFVVTDPGTDWRALTSMPSPLWPPAGGAELILVTRATVPGVCHTELALAALGGNPFVVGVGARRWPRPVAAAFGPRLSSAKAQGRIGLIPADRRLELNGIDTEPFARPVAAAASQLVELIWPGLTGTANTATKEGRRR